MVDCKFQNLHDVVVRKRIKHFFAASSRLHEFVVAKNPELMRYRADRHIKYRRDVAYAQFVFWKRRKDIDAGAVAEDFEKFRNVKQ